MMITKSQTTKATRAMQGYNIKVVARRTGLSPHVIRVWERRYSAVSPARSATARRLYTDAEIERLLLLRCVTQAGHSIGQVANLATQRLTELVAADNALGVGTPALSSARGEAGVKSEAIHVAENLAAADYLVQCEAASAGLDAVALEAALIRAIATFGPVAMMEEVLAPLLRRLGECWRQGTARIYQEHLVTAVTRAVLGASLRRHEASATAPVILVTTPAGQTHELGALMAAATAAAAGWKTLYLGSNLPIEEIAAVTLRVAPRAVALSIIYPLDDPRLHKELKKLRAYIPPEVILLLGGRGAQSAAPDLAANGALRLDNLPALYDFLQATRLATPPASVAIAPKARSAVKPAQVARRKVVLID